MVSWELLMICKKCGLDKPMSSFRKGRRHCIACRNVYRNEWRKRVGRKEKYDPIKARARYREKNPPKHPPSLPKRLKAELFVPKKKTRPLLDSHEKARRRNEYMRRWWMAQPIEKRQAAAKRNAQWAKNNPDKTKAIRAVIRGRRRGALGNYTTDDIKELYARQEGECRYCKAELEDKYQIDHILPIALGGTNFAWNIQLVCGRCNRMKSAVHPVDFEKRLAA